MLDVTSPNALARFARIGPTVCVTVSEARGSTPRLAGTRMLVGTTATLGTIGGGQMEFMAIDAARAMLAAGRRRDTMALPLGPEIGQCCGGHVALELQAVDAALLETLGAEVRAALDARPRILLFGAGHVGRALAQALLPLPFNPILVDTRADELSVLPEGITTALTAIPESHVRDARPGDAAVILTHDHALDFLIAREALARADLAYVGMIGSATKRATFARWLERETGSRAGLERLTMPIGGAAVRDKRPAVIAALVAAELLARVGAWKAAHAPGETAR